jgi:methyltransferase-like protein
MNLVRSPEEEISKEELNQTVFLFLNNDPEDTISTKNPMLKAIFEVFSKNNGYLSLHNLISLSANKLPEVNFSELEAQAKVSLMDLFLKGKIDIRADFISINSHEMDIPKVWEYVTAQTLYLKQKVVTNLFFESLQLSLFEYYLVRYLDGNNTKEVIISKMLDHFKNEDLISSYKGTKVTSEEKLREIISHAYLDALEKFRNQALLVG